MKKILPWLKKYFVVLLCITLVVVAVVNTVDLGDFVTVESIAGEGEGDNHIIASEEEFNALAEGTVLPLTYRAMGRMIDAAPIFESATVLITFREYGQHWETTLEHEQTSDTGTYHDDTFEFLLAATADALYLKAYKRTSDRKAGESYEEYEEQEFEYYVKGSEVFIRCLQYREIDDGGIDVTERVLGYDRNKALALIAVGELRGKWVRATGTELMKFAEEDFGDFFDDFNPSHLVSYFQEVTFDGGEEPKFTGTNPHRDYKYGNGYEIETGSVQYKYINNTVIEDISNKKTYELKDYLKEGK